MMLQSPPPSCCQGARRLRADGAPPAVPRRLQPARVAKVEQEVSTQAEAAPEQQLTGRVARLRGQKQGSVRVQELGRPLAEYMALPASQYSVLDARMIERISDSSFRCYVGQLKMFGWSAEPVLTVSVNVEHGGCTIRLLSCQIKGSPRVEELNNQFTAQMTNVVRFRECAEEGCVDKDITSSTSLEVCLQVPGWCGFLPTQSIEDVGSGVLQQVLNLMVPRFLQQLQGDYKAWATGEGRKLTK